MQTHAEDEPKTNCRQSRFREEERGEEIQKKEPKRLLSLFLFENRFNLA
jgi:hypothetical protein